MLLAAGALDAALASAPRSPAPAARLSPTGELWQGALEPAGSSLPRFRPGGRCRGSRRCVCEIEGAACFSDSKLRCPPRRCAASLPSGTSETYWLGASCTSRREQVTRQGVARLMKTCQRRETSEGPEKSWAGMLT